MDKDCLKLLEDFKKEKITNQFFLKSLQKIFYHLHFDVVGEIATLDPYRQKQTGIEEVIFAQGKHYQNLKTILFQGFEKKKKLLITKLKEDIYQSLAKDYQKTIDKEIPLIYDPISMLAFSNNKNNKKNKNTKAIVANKSKKNIPSVAILSAGTCDIGVAEECRLSLSFWGIASHKIYDIGVSNISRLISMKSKFHKAKVIVVVAGMEAALATVVNGMVKAPVIAVPTSIGYGASFNGLAALLGMMNSCSPGISVVNIDNGFGAAAVVKKILG